MNNQNGPFEYLMSFAICIGIGFGLGWFAGRSKTPKPINQTSE